MMLTKNDDVVTSQIICADYLFDECYVTKFQNHSNFRIFCHSEKTPCHRILLDFKLEENTQVIWIVYCCLHSTAYLFSLIR